MALQGAVLCAWGAVGVTILGQPVETSDRVIALIVFIQTIIVAFAAGIAWRQVRASVRTARIKSSFDTITAEIGDADLILMRNRWRQIRREMISRKLEITYPNMLRLEGALNPATTHSDDHQIIQFDHPHRSLVDYIIQVCNYYEAVAVGIRRGAIDRAMYRDWWRTSFVLDWVDLHQFVLGYRDAESVPGAYIEFEALACEWITREEIERLPETTKATIKHRRRLVNRKHRAIGTRFRGVTSNGQVVTA